MVNLYITLIKIALELRNNLCNSRLTGLISFRKNEFYLNFGLKGAIGVFLYPAKPLIFFQKQLSVPGKNVVSLFQELQGHELTEVYIHNQDRLIRLVFTGGRELVIQLFSASAGMTLYQNGIEAGTIRKKSDPVSTSDWINITQNHVNSLVIQTATNSLQRFLKSTDETIQWSPGDLSSTQYWIYQGTQRSFISPVEVQGFELVSASNNGSIAIKQFVLDSVRVDQFEKEKAEIHKILNGRLVTINQTIQRLTNWLETENPGERDELFGHLLSTAGNQAEKGISQITIENWISGQGEPLTIAVNPVKTIRENAEAYYSRSKRQKTTFKEKMEVKKQQQQLFQQITNLINETKKTCSVKDLKELKSQNPALFSKTRGDEGVSEPVIRFISSWGHEILVGKHAKGNDYLLTKLSRKNDIWLHCRGDAGSHVIIPNKEAVYPSKSILQEAASLAAGYSRQQKSEWVPVSYTFVKYVRKPKGAAPGAVILEREEVIFVKPSRSLENQASARA